jgi:hypothetical protein
MSIGKNLLELLMHEGVEDVEEVSLV